MLKFLLSPLKLAIVVAACLSSSPSFAQVTGDSTVDTQVNQNGNVTEITGGQARGSNLFHSFQDFSVQTGNEAFFNNVDSISNIFSRVTGENISNIDGAIRANGDASLFLINPAGIIFGENARLDIGGSFYGSTASTILFPDGEFSAVDNLAQPVLMVNAPIGLGFRDNPAEIVNRSQVANNLEEIVGLEIGSGNNMAFVGGNLNFEGGQVTAKGGNIYLGGLGSAGTVNFNPDGSLSFPENANLANITIINGVGVDTAGVGGGNITVDAKNLTLEAGELGLSFIRSGIRAESTNPEAQAGNITIDVTENIILNNSRIVNQVESGGTGNSGNITIDTASLELNNGALVDASTGGQGDGGTINITATENIAIDGQGSASGIISLVNVDAVGNSGKITISTTDLDISNMGLISTLILGQGNSGEITISTADLNLSNMGAISTLILGQGNSGEITISTADLDLNNGGLVTTDIFGQGNAGGINVTATENIIIDANDFSSGITSKVGLGAEGNAGGVTVVSKNLNLINGGQLDASTMGRGNAGVVNITATENLNIDGISSEGFFSGITSIVDSEAEGNSGGVTVSAFNLNLTNGGRVAADTFGRGNAGAIEVTARDIVVDGENSNGIASAISSVVKSNAVGDAGGISITTTNLNLTNGGRVDANTFGQGNAGPIDVIARESILIDGSIERFRSGISANALVNNGNGGNVFISTDDLTINNGGTIEATNFDSLGNFSSGTGQPGNVTIAADSIQLTNDSRIEAATQSTQGVRGNIDIEVAEGITLRNNSLISARAFETANGGNLNLDTKFIIAFPDGNNDIIASAEQGQGGNININANALFGIEERPLSEDTNDINASSEFSLDGTIAISTPGINPVQGAAQLPTNVIVPQETSQQACQVNRELAAENGLNIEGKGGIVPDPALPLDALNIYIDDEFTSAPTIPSPMETVGGKIQPARGILVADSGDVILTPYRTNNYGDRISSTRDCR